MFKRLFLGNTNIDFHNIGSRFYKIFIIEFIIFFAVLIGSISGFLNLNLSVDFTGGTTYQLDSEYTDNDIDDVLNNTILPVSGIKHSTIQIQSYLEQLNLHRSVKLSC